MRSLPPVWAWNNCHNHSFEQQDLNYMKSIVLVITLLITGFIFCEWRMPQVRQQKMVQTDSTDTLPPDHLTDYWYQGKAEINRFELLQNRYNDLHKGEAIMIFVTEDFLTDQQVKNDNYKNTNSVLVLKNNAIRRFATGIYDYSVMSSVFTPVGSNQWPHTLKVTNTVQDWCGQTFMQINSRENNYESQLRSYFENEGDQNTEVPMAFLEDEIFNRIRINPERLPLGKIKILPGAWFVRLKHVPFEVQEVETSLQPYQGHEFQGDGLQLYKVIFPKYERTLEIVFESKLPYLIAGWKDTYPSLFDKQVRTTTARRTNITVTDYWKKNKVENEGLRKELGVEGF